MNKWYQQTWWCDIIGGYFDLLTVWFKIQSFVKKY